MKRSVLVSSLICVLTLPTATLAQPKATAAYRALLTVADGHGKAQQVIAEFLEDWATHLACFHGDTAMEHKHAVAAVRRVTIESLSRTESTQEQLSASRSESLAPFEDIPVADVVGRGHQFA